MPTRSSTSPGLPDPGRDAIPKIYQGLGIALPLLVGGLLLQRTLGNLKVDQGLLEPAGIVAGPL